MNSSPVLYVKYKIININEQINKTLKLSMHVYLLFEMVTKWVFVKVSKMAQCSFKVDQDLSTEGQKSTADDSTHQIKL